jgi:hypothetical protein
VSDPNVVGYCGVIVPSHEFWQGFFIDRRLEAEGLKTLDRVRRELARIMPVAGAQPETRKPVPGVADADQTLVGTLAATFVEGAVTQRHELVGVVSAALRALLKTDYFCVLARRDTGGTATEIIALRATTPDEARAEINSLPDVLAIKAKLTEGLLKRKAPH